MKVQVQLSIYPLKTQSLSEPIKKFCKILKEKGLSVETQTMSTTLSGDTDIVFKTLQEAFEQTAEKYNIVMDLKISNSCPEKKNKF